VTNPTLFELDGESALGGTSHPETINGTSAPDITEGATVATVAAAAETEAATLDLSSVVATGADFKCTACRHCRKHAVYFAGSKYPTRGSFKPAVNKTLGKQVRPPPGIDIIDDDDDDDDDETLSAEAIEFRYRVRIPFTGQKSVMC
jgi:hypothetical protein